MSTGNSRARRRELLRITAGLLFWVVLIVQGSALFDEESPVAATKDRLLTHVTKAPPRYAARFPKGSPLAVGNPLRIRVANGFFTAGRVEELRETDEGFHALVSIYPEYAERLGPDARLIAARTAGNVAWILEVMLPDDRRDFIEAQLRRRWERERGRLIKDLQPGLKRLAGDSFELLRRRLPDIVDEHRHDIDQMMEVLRDRGWKGELEDSFREVVWPEMRRAVEPIVAEIGEEIVEEVPYLSLVWTIVKNKMALDSKNELRNKLGEFMREDAVPILLKHEDELQQVVRDVVTELARDERIRAATGRAVSAVVDDPRFTTAFGNLLESLLLEDAEVQAFIEDVWNREDLREPLEDFGRRFQPEVRRIAEALVLDETRKGINPDLARVLRRKLLREDEDFVLLETGDASKGDAPSRLPGENGGIR